MLSGPGCSLQKTIQPHQENGYTTELLKLLDVLSRELLVYLNLDTGNLLCPMALLCEI